MYCIAYITLALEQYFRKRIPYHYTLYKSYVAENVVDDLFNVQNRRLYDAEYTEKGK